MHFPILIIGGGTMGEILLRGVLAKHSPDKILVAESNTNRASYLTQHYNVHVQPLAAPMVNQAEVIFLAVKPQDCAEVAFEIKSGLSNQLLISVMAGINLQRLHELFITDYIVRTMPNTPASIGLGMTVWTATETVTDNQRNFVQNILTQFGEQLYVDNEDDIDKATAINGSGPAYVFLFAEHLLAAAQDLGFNDKTARLLVAQTLRGASELFATSNETPLFLRERVTSKGGTTEAAIYSLPIDELSEMWKTAVQAAYKRSKEL